MPIIAQKLPSVGQRVGAVDGSCQSPRNNAGTVTEVVTNRWGTHAVVQMDDGSKETCHGLNSQPGIGWFLLEGV